MQLRAVTVLLIAVVSAAPLSGVLANSIRPIVVGDRNLKKQKDNNSKKKVIVQNNAKTVGGAAAAENLNVEGSPSEKVKKGPLYKRKGFLDLSGLDLLGDSIDVQVFSDLTNKTFQHDQGVGDVMYDSGGKAGFKKKFWHGVADDGSEINLLETTAGTVGSSTDIKRGYVYQIGIDAGGKSIVTETASNDFPPEHETPQETDAPDMSRWLKYEAVEKFPRSETEYDSRGPWGQRSLAVDDEGGNIDLMVVWTKDAECKQSFLPEDCELTDITTANMEALIALCVEETNAAYVLSGVESRLRLVHAYLDTDFSYPDNSDDIMVDVLADYKNTGDGKSDNVHVLREQYGADVVAVLVGYSDGACGVGYVGPSKELMFSATSYVCATGVYTFGHEVGHNMGCQHDRGSAERCNSFKSDYNYGYRQPQSEFRTIMSYNCGKSSDCDISVGGGCPRIQRFSSNTIKYNGKDTGDELNDCSRFFNDVKADVASYYDAIPDCIADSDCDDANTCTEDSCDSGQCINKDVSTCEGTFCNPQMCDPDTGSCIAAPRPCLNCQTCDGVNAECLTPTQDTANFLSLKVEVRTDNYGSETSWKLNKNDVSNTEIIDEQTLGSYSDGSGRLFDYEYSLTCGTYAFTMMDDFSDGMCCGNSGDGYYKLVLDDVVVGRGDKFFAEEVASFDVDPESAALPTPSPTEAPVGGNGPTDAPTNKPTSSSCIECSDIETTWMSEVSQDCTTSDLINTKCNLSDKWSSKKFCQLSCYNAGFGYSGDVCCNGNTLVCIRCTDSGNTWMTTSGDDCATSDSIATKCNKSSKWGLKKFCQLSCYNAGYGYSGDVCCIDERRHL